MQVELHPHAMERLTERGVMQSEVIETVLSGERSRAKFGRLAFRKVFVYDAIWRGRLYRCKEVEAIAVEAPAGLLVLTVIARYF